MNCLSVFDHFVGLALEGLLILFFTEALKIHAGVYFSILLVHVQGRQI